MDVILLVLSSAPHNQMNSDKAASGRRSKPLPIIAVALLWSNLNTVAKISCLHQSQTSTTTLCSQFSSGFLPDSLTSQFSSGFLPDSLTSQFSSGFLPHSLTHSLTQVQVIAIAYNVLHYLYPSPLISPLNIFILIHL